MLVPHVFSLLAFLLFFFLPSLWRANSPRCRHRHHHRHRCHLAHNQGASELPASVSRALAGQARRVEPSFSLAAAQQRHTRPCKFCGEAKSSVYTFLYSVASCDDPLDSVARVTFTVIFTASCITVSLCPVTK